jgi:hypothetical protein
MRSLTAWSYWGYGDTPDIPRRRLLIQMQSLLALLSNRRDITYFRISPPPLNFSHLPGMDITLHCHLSLLPWGPPAPELLFNGPDSPCIPLPCFLTGYHPCTDFGPAPRPSSNSNSSRRDAHGEKPAPSTQPVHASSNTTTTAPSRLLSRGGHRQPSQPVTGAGRHDASRSPISPTRASAFSAVSPPAPVPTRTAVPTMTPPTASPSARM